MSFWIAIIFFISFYVGVTVWVLYKKNKAKRLITNLNKQEQQDNANSYINSFVLSNKTIIDSITGGANIIAYTFGTSKYNNTDNNTDWKDQLADVSMIKFGTSAYYDIILLSEDNLSIIDMELKKGFLIPFQSINNISIEDLPNLSEERDIKSKSVLPYQLKRYKLTISTSDKMIEIIFYNSLNIGAGINNNIIDLILKDNSELHLQNYVVGNFFLWKLKKQFTNLQIQTCFD